LDALALIGTVVLAGRKCQFQRPKTVIRGFIPYQGELRVKLTYFATRTNFMAKIGLFFGTQTGKTETVAEMIQKEFGGEAIVELHDILLRFYRGFCPLRCPDYRLSHLEYRRITKRLGGFLR
jgi:hypothetical protein